MVGLESMAERGMQVPRPDCRMIFTSLVPPENKCQDVKQPSSSPGGDQPADAAYSHSPDDQQHGELNRKKANRGHVHRSRQRDEVVAAQREKCRGQRDDRYEGADTTLDNPFYHEWTANIGGRSSDELHDLDFVTPRVQRQ